MPDEPALTARRPRQLLMLAALGWLAWLAMTLCHELGHVAGARLTGGVVRRVVWHPLVLSRTDVSPNPHPLVELWAGPLVGCALPLLVAAIAWAARSRVAYLFTFVAGFCLIANGAYLGVGAVDPVGDARQLLARGAPRWTLALFGVATGAAGLTLWHRAGPSLGFGRAPRGVDRRLPILVIALVAALTMLGLLFGDRG